MPDDGAHFMQMIEVGNTGLRKHYLVHHFDNGFFFAGQCVENLQAIGLGADAEIVGNGSTSHIEGFQGEPPSLRFND